MYHNFFIHSSDDGHLGCFHVLAIFFQLSFSQSLCPGSELLSVALSFHCAELPSVVCTSSGFIYLVISLFLLEGEFYQIQDSWLSAFSFNILNISACWLTVFLMTSVQFFHSVVSDSLRPHGLQHVRPPCPSPTPRVYSNSCPLSQ